MLVTGGAGFIGSHVVDHLIEQGHSVIVLDNLSGGLIKNVNPKAKFIKGSINDEKLVDELVSQVDIIFHLAAYAAEGLSHFIRKFNYMNNLIGSINLINSAIRNKIECFVFTSSMAVYGAGKPPFDEEHIPHPEDPYGISKHAVEQDLKIANKLYGLNYVIVRPHNIYGERQFLGDPYRNVICIFINRIMQNKSPVIYGDGEQTRAFSYIGDVAHCIANVPFVKEAQNQITNLGSGKVYTLNKLATKIREKMGSNLEVIHAPERYEVKHAYTTTAKSERIFGFKDETSLDEGLNRTIVWAKEVGPMPPIVWGGYEIEHKLPEFWKELKRDFPDAPIRINIKDY